MGPNELPYLVGQRVVVDVHLVAEPIVGVVTEQEGDAFWVRRDDGALTNVWISTITGLRIA